MTETNKINFWCYGPGPYLWHGDYFSEELMLCLYESLKSDRENMRHSKQKDADFIWPRMEDKEARLLLRYVNARKRENRKVISEVHGLGGRAMRDGERNSLHPADILHDLFMDKLSLDFEFAKNLQLFDIIEPDCWTTHSKEAEALISVIYPHCVFVVSTRRFESKSILNIEFTVSHEDCVDDMISELRLTGKVRHK